MTRAWTREVELMFPPCSLGEAMELGVSPDPRVE